MSPKNGQIFHRIFTSTIFVIDKIKKYPLFALFLFLGLIFFVLGLISLLASSSNDSAIIFEGDSARQQEVLSATASASQKGILVDVAGAVVSPGVYRIGVNGRIKDALIAAHGLAENADREYVSKNINLAQKLVDGGKIYIPTKTDNLKLKIQNYEASENGSINVNTASSLELESLPGVGAVTAQKIIDNRPYGAIEELIGKKSVSKSVFEKIKEKITLY